MAAPRPDPETRLRYLARMGITVWRQRQDTLGADQATSGDALDTASADHSAAPASMPDWGELEALVATCERCGLCSGRTQTVFGVGDRNADLLIIGEAPGAEEDRRGEPFVGRAGRLLDAMLHALGLGRGQGVYIANILKCRPPGNRDPVADEVASCSPYLEQQIALLRPRVILAVGRIAAQFLLRTDRPLKAMRQADWYYPGSGIPVVVSYHPAYLLRNPADKFRAWQDLKRLVPLLRPDRS